MAWLVDVNVLVALLNSRHRHCGKAIEWLEQREHPDSVAICRVAQMGALRLLSQRAGMEKDTISPAEFWIGWDRMMSDVRFSIVGEPSFLEAEWRRITSLYPRGQCAETDAYFAAFGLSGGFIVVTFDHTFRRFEEIALEILN